MLELLLWCCLLACWTCKHLKRCCRESTQITSRRTWLLSLSVLLLQSSYHLQCRLCSQTAASARYGLRIGLLVWKLYLKGCLYSGTKGSISLALSTWNSALPHWAASSSSKIYVWSVLFSSGFLSLTSPLALLSHLAWLLIKNLLSWSKTICETPQQSFDLSMCQFVRRASLRSWWSSSVGSSARAIWWLWVLLGSETASSAAGPEWCCWYCWVR